MSEAIRDGEAKSLRVVRVEYLCDGEVIETVQGDSTRSWDGERFPAKYRLPGPGEYRFEVRVTVIDPFVQAGNPHEILQADPLSVSLKTTFEEWMLEYPVQGNQNLLRTGKVSASASSKNNDGQGPEKAVDGLHGTYWIAGQDDAKPTLTLELGKPARTNVILLSQVNCHARQTDAHDHVTRLNLYINRTKEPIEIELDPDDRRKTVYRLAKRQSIRRLQIEILDRVPGKQWPKCAGFSEVELLYVR